MIPYLLPQFAAIRAPAATFSARLKETPASIEDAEVVDRGALSGEISFLAALRGSNAGDSPLGLSFSYGIASRTEIDFGVGALSGSPTYRRGERDGFGDLSVGSKTQLIGGNDGLALSYGVVLLTADRPKNDDRVDQSLSLLGSQTRGRLEWTENLGTTLPGSTIRRATPIFGGGIVYDAGAGTAFSMQANRNQPQSALLSNKLQYGAGFTHAFSRAFSFEAQVGRSGRGRRNTGLFFGGTMAFGSAR